MAALSEEDRAKAIAILEELRRRIAGVAGKIGSGCSRCGVTF
jgi:hypothetical protein